MGIQFSLYIFQRKLKDGHITADKLYFGLISWQVIADRLVYVLLLQQMVTVILHRTLQLIVDHLYNSKSS